LGAPRGALPRDDPNATSKEVTSGLPSALHSMVGMTEPITVLLVEDDSDLRYLEQQALEMDGYTVLAAHDGPEALRIADQHVGPIGLLITDLIIPGIGGQGLARRLRATRRELKVLYVSGYADQKTLAAHDPGVPLLRKPFRLDGLRALVRELLAGPGAA